LLRKAASFSKNVGGVIFLLVQNWRCAMIPYQSTFERVPNR
jgi:hypothetical protein